jgi:hypothetical protein
VSRFIYCYAECRYAECRYAECHYAERRYAECRGAWRLPELQSGVGHPLEAALGALPVDDWTLGRIFISAVASLLLLGVDGMKRFSVVATDVAAKQGSGFVPCKACQANLQTKQALFLLVNLRKA